MRKVMMSTTKEAIIEEFKNYVSPSKVAVYKRMGIELVPGRREGSYIWDKEGKRYIDCRTAGGVFNLGHRPPRVIAALREAMETLDIGDHILMSEYRAALAKRLAELMPGDIRYTFFGASGGEAIDLAIKLARGYTQRPKIISAERAYHGHTGFALAAGSRKFQAPFGPLMSGFLNVPFGDIEALEAVMDDEVAAVIFETIPVPGGVLIPPRDYFPQVRELCDRRGALLILDEVQAGLGRTGRLWGIEEYHVVPDIMVLGKGLSGAIYPITATCYRENLESFFEPDPFIHLSSFGGAELGCVAAMAMLDQITEPGFLEHVQEMGTRFQEGLALLGEKYPQILIEVRQRGLLIGLKMVDQNCGPMLTRALGQNGVLAIFAGLDPSVTIIMPPLIVTREEVDLILEALDRSYQAVVEQMLA
jgi:putrescine aminotransferase